MSPSSVIKREILSRLERRIMLTFVLYIIMNKNDDEKVREGEHSLESLFPFVRMVCLRHSATDISIK